MRTALKDKTLNLYLEGRIDSNNATHFEKEIIPDEMRHGALAKFKPAFFENVNKPGFADILTII